MLGVFTSVSVHVHSEISFLSLCYDNFMTELHHFAETESKMIRFIIKTENVVFSLK
jgi:hypothetical protein